MNLLLFFHLFGAMLFLGNIVTAAFWKVRADGSGHPAAIHQTVKNVMLADYVFTLPGLLLIVVTGSIMAERAGYPMSGLNWLTVSLIVFAGSGAIWLAVLLPVQRRMIRYSAEALETGRIPASYRHASLYWAVFGILSILSTIVILYLMVTKAF